MVSKWGIGMEGSRWRLARLATVMTAGLLLASCLHHVLRTSELSPPLSRSLLKDLAPKTLAFREFTDIRTAEDPLIVMKLGVHTYALEDPPATLVAQWVRREFERNGHRCLPDSPAVRADFIVEGTVYRFSLRQHSGFSSLTETADTAVRLTIGRVPAGAGTLAKSYRGQYAVNGYVTWNLWKTAIHQALMAMIQEMTTDPELKAFLAG